MSDSLLSRTLSLAQSVAKDAAVIADSGGASPAPWRLYVTHLWVQPNTRLPAYVQASRRASARTLLRLPEIILGRDLARGARPAIAAINLL